MNRLMFSSYLSYRGRAYLILGRPIFRWATIEQRTAAFATVELS